MNESTEKTHTCIRCGSYKSKIYEIKGNIMVICRQLERDPGPTKAAELKAKMADLKEQLKRQKATLEEHIEEALYAPTAS